MQTQIQAIKQILETNNAIAESIDQCIIEWAGESASWEQAATFETAEEFNPETKPEDFDPVFKVLWRSRIDLNDAKHHAKLADLDDFKGTADEVLLEKIEELRGIIDQNKGAFAKELGAALDLITERDRVISGMETEIDRLKGWLGKRENQLQELWGKKEPDTAEPQADDLAISLKFSNNVISERNSQIEELQISLKNHHEQFDNLKSHFEVTLKVIAKPCD
jgi:uncharacterized coiled-coil protein SlyX